MPLPLAIAAVACSVATIVLVVVLHREDVRRLDAVAARVEGARDEAAALAQQLSQERGLAAQRHAALATSVGQLSGTVEALRDQTDRRLGEVRDSVDRRLQGMQETQDRRLQGVQATVDQRLRTLQADNGAQLERMRATVDEKLQETLDVRIRQSFELVNKQLEAVSRGLGEMQGLATDVGGLKRVLSNVKARGIVGEIQLGAILREVLSPAQYEENVACVPGSAARVEFAVRLPGESGETVWLPIDSKFPGDAYEHLRAAQDAGDAAAAEAAWKTLEGRIRQEARDIRDKYVEPPATTTFGILFLPFEGLYAEVVDRPGLLEELQRIYHVNVAGPSTMAALLSSLQMGFQTVAIQRRAAEVQNVLAAVKTEFGKYHASLLKARRQLNTVGNTVDELLGARTNKMSKALSGIVELESLEEADRVLGIGPVDLPDPADAGDAAASPGAAGDADETGE